LKVKLEIEPTAANLLNKNLLGFNMKQALEAIAVLLLKIDTVVYNIAFLN